MYPTRNKIVWLCKRVWLERWNEESQVEIHGVVSDWLEMEGHGEEARTLRSGRWVMWYVAETNTYRVYRPGEWPDEKRSYAVMWWPIKVCVWNSERYTDSLGRPVGPMPGRTSVPGV